MQPKIVKLPHLRVSHVNDMSSVQTPVPAAPRAPEAEPDDWSTVFVPAREMPHTGRSKTAHDEVQALANLWGGPTGEAVEVPNETVLEELWMADVTAVNQDVDVTYNSGIEFDSDPDYFIPRSAYEASSRFRVDRPSSRPVQRPRADDGTLASIRERARGIIPTPASHQEVSSVAPPREATERPKTPMERAAEYASRPSAYKRLRDV